MIDRRTVLIVLALGMPPATAVADVELAPFAGMRFGGGFEVAGPDGHTESEVEFGDSASVGFTLSVDLAERGKQLELYYSHQDTTAYVDDAALFGNTRAFELNIDQLQFGGLYFPGGDTRGGFVSGTLGVTRLDPQASGLRTHHRASIALGGGAKIPLQSHLGLRFDLRGVYTVLDSGAAVFCSGGCVARFASEGFVQVEASIGLSLKF